MIKSMAVSPGCVFGWVKNRFLVGSMGLVDFTVFNNVCMYCWCIML